MERGGGGKREEAEGVTENGAMGDFGEIAGWQVVKIFLIICG